MNFHILVGMVKQDEDGLSAIRVFKDVAKSYTDFTEKFLDLEGNHLR